MNSQRIEMLKRMVLEDPGDPFNPYALGLEHLHTNRPEALSIFIEVMNRYPDYLPTYYQAGLLSIESNQEEKGKTILEKGMEVAQKQNDRKALNELRSLLDNL